MPATNHTTVDNKHMAKAINLTFFITTENELPERVTVCVCVCCSMYIMDYGNIELPTSILYSSDNTCYSKSN